MQTMELSNEKCKRHGQRYCAESTCSTSLVARQAVSVDVSNGASIEDSLVGRSTAVSITAPTVPSPVVVQPTTTTWAPIPAKSVALPESGEHPLVAASLEYAKASEVYRKAVEFVRDCEKRLEFAQGDVADALQGKNQAFEKVRSLVGEQSNAPDPRKE